jgi:hypothetical protein
MLPRDPNFKSLDSYDIFLESGNHFQRQTKARRYEISKAMFVCKILVKVFTGHLTDKRGIQKNACHMI